MDRKARLKLPTSTRDILTLFSLSRTNQILRGRSPIFEEKDDNTKGWAELVASEIYSAKVDVVPIPAGKNIFLMCGNFMQGIEKLSSNFFFPERNSCSFPR